MGTFFDTSKIDLNNLETFLYTPIPKGQTIKLQIKRDKSWLNRFFPTFYLYTSDDYK